MSNPPEPGAEAGRAQALEIRALSYSYGGRQALRNVSLRVLPGSFTALLGHNGAGKTTLFSLALRLLEPPPGKVLIAGRDLVRDGSSALAPIGVVFQEPTLDLDLTVGQNLCYFAGLRGLPSGLAARRADAALAALDMGGRMGERVRKLSGGQRRRVEIARALLHEPMVLLLDEPTVGLDVPTRRAIVAHVHRLAREGRVGVLWATHLIDEVGAEDDLVVLHQGRVMAQGPVAGLIKDAGANDLAGAFQALTRNHEGGR